MLGVRLDISGTLPSQGLLVANHISWLDVYAINAVAPAIFLSKDEVRHWPLIGWFASRAGTLFLERGSRSAAQRAKDDLIHELRADHLVCVFPEGTTGLGDQVATFHSALFQSAIDAKVAVTPALIRYLDHWGRPSLAAAYVGETSLWESVRDIVATSGLSVRIAFLPAVATAGAERRHLAHHSHQLISHALTKLTPSPAAPPDAHTAIGTRDDPPSEPPSGSRPTDSRNPEPADSSRA